MTILIIYKIIYILKRYLPHYLYKCFQINFNETNILFNIMYRPTYGRARKLRVDQVGGLFQQR